MGDTTSVFSEFKNGENNTLLFKRTCESKCCWGNVHSKNAFIMKCTSNGWFFWCYGNECNNDGKMFRIDAIHDTDSTPIDEIIESFNNTTVFKCDTFQYLNCRVVDNIAITRDCIQRVLSKFIFLFMNSTGVYVQTVGSKYYFRKTELLKLDMDRFEFTLFDINSNAESFKPYDLVRSNKHMIAIERVVTEPDYPKFQPIHFEQQTVFNIWNGFPLMNEIEDNKEFF